MLKYLPFIIVFALLASCQKAELQAKKNALVDSALTPINVASVNGPTTAKVNEDLYYNVSWPDSSTRYAFSSFKVSSSGNLINITLLANKRYCSNCATGNQVTSAVYRFKPLKSGIYYLKFLNADSNRSIIDTLLVK